MSRIKCKDGSVVVLTPRFGCKTCGKEANVFRLAAGKVSIECCGIYETKYLDAPVGNRDMYGRLHGAQPTFGVGETRYTHGSISYLDDGNGNVFDEDDL